MSYILAGQNIRRPKTLEEGNSTQYAQVRTIAGTNHRDFLGGNKRIWTLQYENVNISDYNTINAIYQNYLATKAAVTFQVSEVNYTVAQTNVHVDLTVRQFMMPGSSYISNFVLILTEV